MWYLERPGCGRGSSWLWNPPEETTHETPEDSSSSLAGTGRRHRHHRCGRRHRLGGPACAAAVPLTLSAATGPSGGTNTITATATTNIFTTAVTPAAEFQYVGTGTAAACSPT
jgi:hypothetical protein